ncbi:HlyD family efflux transporter periplasmic adaptor subunit [Desulfofundulus thermosubterraneus]|uniref:Putative membrane fusion protein n=1 Tax=Desulfofundulus thermosubterraneus DSM 16057 TaxID=1121432 RepID=A0A1M6CGJ2_9FIRM|nr:HlyD family efflux transporter periplasmic adaptor subunit [Desulfofundulus thermosubterraneus]SHI59808.1 putative membrane fusion protein [Desulfofundulus thermosubterraneus DSM 16057]
MISLFRASKIFPLVILVSAVLFSIWWLGNRVWNLVETRQVRLEWLEEDKVSRTITTSGWLIKEERLLHSPGRGQLRLLVGDGQRVRAGEAVAEILLSDNGDVKKKMVVYAPWGGVFCNHIDGLEKVLRPGNALEMEAVEKLGAKSFSLATGDRVEKGQPVGKLVDNLSGMWYWCRVPQEETNAGKWSSGQQVVVLWRGQQICARLEKITGKEMLFLLPVYPGDLVQQRHVQLELVAGEVAGYLVLPRAVVERDGHPGIYVISRRRATWVPVQVLGETSGRVVISGRGLSTCTRYVANPLWVREGDRLE